MNSKKPNLDEYDELGERLRALPLARTGAIGALELFEIIENMLNNIPKQKTKAKPWIKVTNEYINICNERFGKTFNKVK